MDELSKSEIRELLELTRENNELLKGVHKRARWSMFFFVFRWAITFGLLIGAYYYVEPYVDMAKDAYQNTSNILRGVQASSDSVKNSDAAKIINKQNGDVVDEDQKTLLENILKSLGL